MTNADIELRKLQIIIESGKLNKEQLTRITKALKKRTSEK